MKTLQIKDGDFIFQTLDGAEALRQTLIHSLKMERGEWFLDPEKGLAWPHYFKRKTPPKAALEREIKKTLISHPEVLKIQSLTSNFDTKRKLSVKFQVKTSHGVLEANI